jgi:hypothetical protein
MQDSDGCRAFLRQLFVAMLLPPMVISNSPRRREIFTLLPENKP